MAYDAFLLLSFGGPEHPDDVLPFLENVTRGRGVPRERLAEVAEHYHHFGGVSPINRQCRELLAAIRDDFAANGLDLPAYWGNRNWHPMLADTLARMRDDGVKRAVAFVTSAYGGYSSCRQYREDIAAAQALVGAGAPVVDKLRHFHDHPGFVEPHVDAVRSALATLDAGSVPGPSGLGSAPGSAGLGSAPGSAGLGSAPGSAGLGPAPGSAGLGLGAGPGESGAAGRDGVRLVFTAHSIPVSMAERAGPEGGLYEAQLRETAALVAASAAPDLPWDLVWQSRSGPPHVPWLAPDVNDHLATVAAAGATGVVVSPIGFVSDHLEVVWDLDTEAAATAKSLGLAYARAGTPGTDPRFVTMVRELVSERLDTTGPAARRRLGTLPTWDTCPGQCCPVPSTPRPTMTKGDT